MKYSVEWTPDTADDLAQLWMTGPDRQAITNAANQIDQSLEQDPSTQGESRPKGRRIFFIPPLGVIFRINRRKKLVRVVEVWRCTPPP